MDKTKILIIGATAHEGSQTKRVVEYLNKYLSARDDIELKSYTTSDLDMKMSEEVKAGADEYKELAVWADGYLIVSPEYNHSFPGSLKMLLDLLYKEYEHKAVAIAGVSSGILGGARMIENLIPVLRELHLYVCRESILFASVRDAFSDTGEPNDPKTNGRVDKTMNELVWLASTLRDGRDNFAPLPKQ